MYPKKLLQGATTTSKKLFKSESLPIYPIMQSKQMKIGNHTYTLIGQQMIKGSPLLTNFIVYDENNDIAPPTTANEIYYYTMLTVYIDTFQSLNKTFKGQEKLAEQGEESDDYGIGFVGKEIVEAWQALQNKASELRTLKQWDEQALATLHTYWEQFWHAYVERSSLLFELGREGKLRNKHDKRLKHMNDCILFEAKIIDQLFHIEAFRLKEDPLHLNEWIQYHAKRANANDRKEMIHTKADKQSQLIMSVILYIFMFILTPYSFWLIYEKNFVMIFFLSLIYIAFFALYYTNKYRLEKTFQKRMLPNWQKKNEETPIFRAAATSVNMSAAVFYIVIATLTMLGYYWYTDGWNHYTNILLLVNIFVLGFTIWFAYSPFVEKIMIFYPEKILAGHRELHVDQIERIEMDEDGVTYEFYLTYLDESYELRIENEDQARTKHFMILWCEENGLHMEWKK